MHDEMAVMTARGNKVVAKKKLLGVCGTFKKSFNKGLEPTWEETRGYAGVPLGSRTLYLQPLHPMTAQKRTDVKNIDMWFNSLTKS